MSESKSLSGFEKIYLKIFMKENVIAKAGGEHQSRKPS
jgi:hypothetical protein